MAKEPKGRATIAKGRLVLEIPPMEPFGGDDYFPDELFESQVRGWAEGPKGTVIVRVSALVKFAKLRTASGICPVCGERIRVLRTQTADGRLIGSCLDAFSLARWNRR